MKKRWKKAASLLLALVMVFSILVFPASALGSSQDTDTAEFDIVSQHAENYLKILSTVDQNDISVSINYQNVSIGTPIPIYSYTNGEVEILNARHYPIFSNNEIVGVVTAYENPNGNLSTQFSTSMAAELSAYLSNHTSIALVGDDYALYATDGVQMSKLMDCVTTVAEPASAISEYSQTLTRLPASAIIADVQTITVCPLRQLSVSASAAAAARDVAFYNMLPVPYVSQNNSTYTNTKICWAACLACTGNYLIGQNKFDAFSLADKYIGRYDQDLHISLFNLAFRPSDYYGIDYYETYYAPPAYSHLKALVDAGYPTIVRVTQTQGDFGWGHFIVAYGYWQDTSYTVLYMDPDHSDKFTMGSVDTNGEYFYVTEKGSSCFVSHSFRSTRAYNG